MVDIHSHVLYGMDDGAKSSETSVAMLQMAQERGITDIVATPHSDLHYQFQPQLIASQIADLRALHGIPRVHRGCDFHLSFDNIEECYRDPSKFTVNGLRYLLVEFADSSIPPYIDEVFSRFQQLHVTPIITHPERNRILSKDPKRVQKWVEGGCRVQITAQSLTGGFGKRAEAAGWHFLQVGLCHFVASDAHDLVHRPPDLQPARHAVENRLGKGTAEALFVEHPTAVLTGADVPARWGEMTAARRWFKLW